MKNTFILIIIILLTNCQSNKKIGDFKYKISHTRVNTGDYDGLIKTITSYHEPVTNRILFGYTTKGQKLHFESKRDTVYVKGAVSFNLKTNTIKTVESFINGYETYEKIDSIVRIFAQEKNGSIKLKEYKEFRNGKEK
tara:strand:- start:1010 stop:1423 length:414 start_codon:yes stop_codon:yes gene_type:complete